MRALLLLALALPLAAEDVDSIVVVPGAHLDIGFTDTPSAVCEKRIRVLDEAIEAAQADPEFRWFEESGWVLHQWREAKDARSLETLRALIKEGRISFSAAWCSPHAAMFEESLDLLFFQADEFEKVFGARPAVAVLNDVPSYPEALVDACARAGVRYLLVGANMAFTNPLPAHLANTPFWWESAAGHRVLTWIDDHAYTAAYMKWGIDPGTARFFNPDDFPGGKSDLETMEAGISRSLKRLSKARGPVLVQHSFDNWDCGAAKRLPACAKAWNEAKKGPRIVLGSPEPAFRGIEARFGKDLPVYRGEWGGQWDVNRASNPIWTWRVREALKVLPKDAPFRRKADLATAMEHSQGLGPAWPDMMTKGQIRRSNLEVAALFTLAAGPEFAAAVPQRRPLPICEADCKDIWKAYLGRINPRIRCGRGWLGPFVVSEAPELAAKVGCGINETRYGCDLTLARKDLPGHERDAVTVVIEFALKAPAKSLRIAPESSAAGRAGTWLRGSPPAFVVAPGGLRLTGLAVPMRVTSPVVFSWCLVPDKDDDNLTWLQGHVAGQSTSCIFKGKNPGTLPWDDIYVGEPAELNVQVFFEILEEK